MAPNKAKKSTSSGGRDFEKKNIKPGKLNPGAVNKTDTSFTAKRLLLKDQHLQHVDSNSTHARLEPCCTSFTRHYSPRNRKEALQNILRILSKEPAVLKDVLDLLTPVLCKSIVEVEAKKEVTQLYSLLLKADNEGTWLRAIWPHPLLAHFLLACTNIDHQVQANCIHLLSLFPNTLLLPIADQLLIPLSKLLKTNDIEKTNSPIVNLIIRILQLLWKEDEPHVIAELVWTPNMVLPSPFFLIKSPSARPLTSTNMITQCIHIITNTLLLPWTEVAYLFLSEKSPAKSDPKETAIYGNSSKLFSNLFFLFNTSGENNDWMEFCKLVPLKMFNSLHKCKCVIINV